MTKDVGTDRVLITGVTGFIGSRVAARWVARAGEVRGLVRRAVTIPGVDGHTTWRAFLEIYADWFGVVPSSAA